MLLCGLVPQWSQFSDEPCLQEVEVCGFGVGDQDNWLITQHVDRVVEGVPLEQVNVEVEFRVFGNCDASVNCQRNFMVNKFETSTVSPATAADITNYDSVERLSVEEDLRNRNVNRTAVLDFETQETGFYVAIQDERSCIAIPRLLVFYYVCPAGMQDLINRAEIIAPRIGEGSVPIQATGQCVPNASTSGTAPAITCTSGGVWNTNSGCTCDLQAIKMAQLASVSSDVLVTITG